MPDDKKQLLITGIAQMRISLVDVLLPEGRQYMGVGKAFWLEKLQELFTQCKEQGDTRLEFMPGRCVSDGCRHKGYGGISFTGNCSGMGFDLIIAVAADGEIADLFQCCGMEHIADSNRQKTLYLDIMEDDKADFIPTPAFTSKSILCRKAIDELAIYRHALILEETWLSWIKEHRTLYTSFLLPPFEYRDFVEFHRLYYYLKNLCGLRKYTAAAKTALDVLRAADLEDTLSLVKWLLRYYRMWNDIDIPLEYNSQMNRSGPLPEVVYYGLRFHADNIIPVSHFYNVFEVRHWQMFADDRTYRKRIIKMNKQNGLYRF